MTKAAMISFSALGDYFEMNRKKETLQLVADTASIAAGQPYIGLTIKFLSLLLDLTVNQEEALDKFLKHMNDISMRKPKKETIH